MKKILKFGVPGRECPHCIGLQAFKGGKFTRDEIRDTYDIMAKHNIHRDEAVTSVRKLAMSKLKGKEHGKEIEEALGHQAKIEQLNHGGWPIEILAWVAICPDCDRVTQYRAMPTSNFIFTKHGPVAESSSCEDCRQAQVKAEIDAENERLSKMSNEEIEAEQKERARKTTIITDEFINLEMTRFKDPTPADNMYIMKLINNKGKTIADIE